MGYIRAVTLGLVFLIVSSAPAFSARDSSALLYKKAAKYYHKLNNSGRKLTRAKWMKSLKKFKNVYTTHPGAPKTPEALYMTGKIYHELFARYKKPSDKANAVNIFRVLVRQYPSSKLADDALYRTGELHLADKKTADALTAFSGVLKWFPKGDMAPKAKKMAAKLERKKRATKKRTKKVLRKKPVTELKNVRLWTNESYARVVFDVSKKVNYKIFRQKDGNALIIDLLGIRRGKKASKAIVPKSGIVKSVQVSDMNNGVSRVKISLKPETVYTTMELANPPRIVLDFNSKAKSLFSKRGSKQSKLLRSARNQPTGKRLMKPSPKRKPSAIDPALIEAGLVKAPKPRVNRPPIKLASLNRPSYRIKTIVIDPGHGGKDPGAMSKRGLKEKDVALDIALRLKKILRKQCACRVLLTRSRDIFIPLEERTAFANTKNADLFISIHVNSHNSGSARGVETYFLSPARSKRAMYTAARENMLAIKSDDQDMNDIAFILSDMQNTEKINESSEMASRVQKGIMSTIRKNYRTRDNGVKQAMFYVLHGARMPSILVETAFISNRTEEKRLRSSTFRQRMAKGIAKGIKNYVSENRVALLAN